MRRRFGRGRSGRNTGEGRGTPIDAERVLARITESEVIGATALAPVSDPEIPAGFAALGSGEREGGRLLVGYAPRNGGDAALAVVSHALGLAARDGFDGEVVALAPQWTIAARRRLSRIGELPFRFRALVAPALGDGEPDVRTDEAEAPLLAPAEQIAAAATSAPGRALFGRALAAFEGLAAKHGGAVRAWAGGIELVLLARCVAVLRAEAQGLVLNTLAPDRASVPLSGDDLAAAMDRLEGSLRKRLNDRRVRGGEEGLRAALLPALAEAAGLREALAWPFGGSDSEVLDLLGVDADGSPVVAAIRSRLDLPGLAAILDAEGALRPALPALLGELDPPVRLAAPRLALAAGEFDAAVTRLLPALALGHVLYDVSTQGREPALALRGAEAGAAPRRAERAERVQEPRPARTPHPETRPTREPRDSREPRESGEGGFEQVSVFDLDAEDAVAGEGEPAAGRRRRRGRGRRRGRRGGAAARGEADASGPEPSAVSDAPEVEAEDEAARDAGEGNGEPRSRRRRPRRGGSRSRASGPERAPAPPVGGDDDELPDETLAPLADDAPDPDEAVLSEPDLPYEDDEEAGEEISADEDRMRRERDARRRARVAKASPEPAPPPPPRPRRRRAAIIAHGDRSSLFAAVLLARDVRLIEGFWVYPQSELMTVFRSVATDLKEEAPIYLVGFTASPARDTLQAAALYQGRLEWFDHHPWPPEDLERLRETLGAENVHVEPGSGSSLPAVLAGRTRRSRFSDKLVELATGRFSLHDYERWGRLWWHRIGEMASRSGPVRSEIEPLLAGRPSDLAREARRADTPVPPPEVEFVSHRDFRLVHFGGYALVVVPTPPGLDPLLAARVARERFAAPISVSWVEGEEVVMLGADEGRGRRGLDLGAMVDHLASKHDWIEALSDEDHVARARVQGLASDADRLEGVIGEIAMGRSILEG